MYVCMYIYIYIYIYTYVYTHSNPQQPSVNAASVNAATPIPPFGIFTKPENG